MRLSIVQLATSLLILTLTKNILPATASEAINAIPDYLERSEKARVQGYKSRGYEWPIPKFIPNTEGWKQLMEDRLAQVSEIEDPAQRFQGYVQTVYPGMVVPNFTEHGFAITRISDDFLQDLQEGLANEYDNRIIEEKRPIFEGPGAWIAYNKELMDRVDYELRGYLQEWVNTEITLQGVFGFRLYRKETSFKMHIDKKGTHSLAYVLHVGSSDDSEPWPFFVEDYNGQTHEVYLQPGDVILYEANKLHHGRVRPLKGSWYCNIFAHYLPTNPSWKPLSHPQEAQFAVPPHWIRPAPKQQDRMCPALKLAGTGLYEPECDNQWCRSNPDTTVKHFGPGEYGYWMDPDGTNHKFAYEGPNDDEL